MTYQGEFLTRYFEENEKNGGKAWNTIFQNITGQSVKRAKSLKLSIKTAYSIENCEKNRYRDISPYDSCRIKLGPDGNYINASPVNVHNAERKYILCQGPLDETSCDFWQMVWEQDVSTLVMLNKLVERGVGKCAAYYPTSEEAEMVYGDFRIVCEEEKEEEDVVCRQLTLFHTDSDGNTQGEKRVTHLQYMQWPDFGVPCTPESFLHLLAVFVRVLGQADSPSVIHCSAGVGRSGSFIVVDSVIRMVEKGAASVDVEQLIISMRESRMGLIQTPQQLRFSCAALAHYFKKTRDETERSSEVGESSGECSIRGEEGRKREAEGDSQLLSKRQDALLRGHDSWRLRVATFAEGIRNAFSNLF